VVAVAAGVLTVCVVGRTAVSHQPARRSPRADRRRVYSRPMLPAPARYRTNGKSMGESTECHQRGFVLTYVEASQSGRYSVVVSNAEGTVTSRSAQLTVMPV